jgi:hypothetical protein
VVSLSENATRLTISVHDGTGSINLYLHNQEDDPVVGLLF